MDLASVDVVLPVSLVARSQQSSSEFRSSLTSRAKSSWRTTTLRLKCRHFKTVVPFWVVKNRVTTYRFLLKFLETRKCQGIRLRSHKSQEKGPQSRNGQGICVVEEI